MNHKNKKGYSLSNIVKSPWFIIPVVAVVYMLLAKLSQLVKIPPGEISPVFAAAGFAFVAVLRFRWPALIGVFLGSILTNVVNYFGQPIELVTLVIGLGAASGAGFSAYLVRRFCNNTHPLSSGKNVIIFVFGGAIIGSVISPAIGVISLSLAGYIPLEYFTPSFLNWWVGDASGVIVLAPFILSMNLKGHYRKNLLHTIEAILLVFALLVLCYYAFLSGLRFDYLLSLLLVYAAFRFGIHSVSALALVITIFATIGTSMGASLYSGNSANITLLHLISFLSVSIGSALILAAIMTEKKLALIEIEKYQNNLEKLVAEQTNDLEAANEELKSTNEELRSTNEELYDKNEIIDKQNSELKITMQHLQETQSNLIQAEKMASLGVLTAGVAHEINNPLNYIMGGYVGLENYINEKGLQHDEIFPTLLNSIKLGVDRATDIVKGLSQFSRDNDTYIEDCDIHMIINNCVVMLNHQLKDRIDIFKNFSNESIKTIGNVGKLHQAFSNVLINSIQAIDKKGTISLSTNKIGKNCIIEISDSGCGITSEILPKITDPFFTTKDPGKGTGLGLSITYNIIRDHKGKIEFYSELNKGTTVKITLPNP